VDSLAARKADWGIAVALRVALRHLHNPLRALSVAPNTDAFVLGTTLITSIAFADSRMNVPSVVLLHIFR
jgi:hypothetical protein